MELTRAGSPNRGWALALKAALPLAPGGMLGALTSNFLDMHRALLKTFGKVNQCVNGILTFFR